MNADRLFATWVNDPQVRQRLVKRFLLSTEPSISEPFIMPRVIQPVTIADLPAGLVRLIKTTDASGTTGAKCTTVVPPGKRWRVDGLHWYTATTGEKATGFWLTDGTVSGEIYHIAEAAWLNYPGPAFYLRAGAIIEVLVSAVTAGETITLIAIVFEEDID